MRYTLQYPSTKDPRRGIVTKVRQGVGMERKRVNSSRIRAVGYDPKERVLEVEFSDGRVLSYSGVSQEIHRQFMAAPSPTSFFEDKIEEDYSPRR